MKEKITSEYARGYNDCLEMLEPSVEKAVRKLQGPTNVNDVVGILDGVISTVYITRLFLNNMKEELGNE